MGVRTTTMQVSIDREKCSGHGRCYTLAPSLYDCDDEGFPVILAETFEDAELVQAARTAEASCPERAISVTEA
jgi:ferredoxin